MTTSGGPSRTKGLPPRGLVVLYLATAHLSLALAFAFTAWNPHAVAGFFYHSWIVGIVHLVTIGWIGMSILGSLYVVSPIVLRMAFAAGKADYVAYACVLIGLIGMVAHFWIAEFDGMAWSAATAACGVGYVVVRVTAELRHSMIHSGVKLHLYFAAVNILAGATMGVLLGFDKVYHFLPGYVLSNVFAHAHLAAVGWVCMTVVGLGYRLLPMVIPAATPSSRMIYLSAILLEAGVVGLFWSLALRSDLTLIFAIMIVAGFASFVGHVIWMVANPTRALQRGRAGALGPPARRECRRHSPTKQERLRPDYSISHIGAAGFWLLLASVCGVAMIVVPATDSMLRVALLYGVFGLVGFLAQVIVGFEQRILPIVAAYWALERGAGVATRPARRQSRRRIAFALWQTGIPALAAGLFLNAAALLGAGAWLLLVAVVLTALDTAAVLSIFNNQSVNLRSAILKASLRGLPSPGHPRSDSCGPEPAR